MKLELEPVVEHDQVPLADGGAPEAPRVKLPPRERVERANRDAACREIPLPELSVPPPLLRTVTLIAEPLISNASEPAIRHELRL